MFFGANSSRPTGSLRQRQKKALGDESAARKRGNILTDVDHCSTLRKPCVASLRTDRHQIGMTDRHHRNAQSSKSCSTASCSRAVFSIQNPLKRPGHDCAAAPLEQTLGIAVLLRLAALTE